MPDEVSENDQGLLEAIGEFDGLEVPDLDHESTEPEEGDVGDLEESEDSEESEGTGKENDLPTIVEDLKGQVSGMQKRIDKLTAINAKLKSKTENISENANKLASLVKPDAPWEARQEYVEISAEREQFERVVSNMENYLDLLIEDPDKARETLTKLNINLPESDMDARRFLRDHIRNQQKNLRIADRKLSVIEDRGRREKEQKDQVLEATVEKFFSFIDDPDAEQAPVVEQVKQEFSHLSGLPEYKFILGLVTDFVVRNKSRESSGKATGAPKIAQRPGVRPKPNSGVSQPRNKETDEIVKAFGSMDSPRALQSFLGSSDEY
jgi:hypothetical protein